MALWRAGRRDSPVGLAVWLRQDDLRTDGGRSPKTPCAPTSPGSLKEGLCAGIPTADCHTGTASARNERQRQGCCVRSPKRVRNASRRIDGLLSQRRYAAGLGSSPHVRLPEGQAIQSTTLCVAATGSPDHRPAMPQAFDMMMREFRRRRPMASNAAMAALAAGLLVSLLAAGCATPVGVKRIRPEEANRQLTASVLTTGRARCTGAGVPLPAQPLRTVP